jgi:hypothetical protein
MTHMRCEPHRVGLVGVHHRGKRGTATPSMRSAAVTSLCVSPCVHSF